MSIDLLIMINHQAIKRTPKNGIASVRDEIIKIQLWQLLSFTLLREIKIIPLISNTQKINYPTFGVKTIIPLPWYLLPCHKKATGYVFT